MRLVSGVSIVAALSWSTVAMQAIKGPAGNWTLSTFLISASFVAMPSWQRFCVSVTASVLLEMERDERRRVAGGGRRGGEEHLSTGRTTSGRETPSGRWGESGGWGEGRGTCPSHWLHCKQHLSPAAAPSQWGSGQQEERKHYDEEMWWCLS